LLFLVVSVSCSIFSFSFYCSAHHRYLHSFPTRRSSDLVDVGMFSPEVILYVAISTIGSYVTLSYELSVANKFIEMFLLLMTATFGSIGFIVGFTVSILYLAHVKALETPYLWPFIPFDAKALMQIMFRIPVPYTNVRPAIVNP